MERKEVRYSEFIIDKDMLQYILNLPKDLELKHMHFLALTDHLKKLQDDNIIKFKYENDFFEIKTEKYIISLIILDSSDYCFYTINKTTGKKGNYTRKLKFEAVKNSLEKYI
ncbi:hypothetical protein MOC08_00975 [Bacillus haynesii]|uniref:hypothetical protein n=1 Tax=Bacillus haynesii TaxID=1925021 RepID=UPI0015945F89|nr:hypothetical protein [Bacillus haynesii]NVB35170.1 hypothetical protein [Bacillus licheniformis]MCY7779007.1 hypothetical protein [Bacillus haynesii]MCY8239801.1 hypothetical protein [Bacillus haynesii]MCY8567929.1 hypothetical protein [Bacillus haynesii]MEC0672688.1 hypothetical protein [Bacillus haynesii]